MARRSTTSTRSPAERTARGRGRRGLSARSWTVRTRVLTVMLAFLVAGLTVTGVLTYAAQFRALEEQVVSELEQERRELDLIARDTDESGAYVHTSVDSVLETATISAVPSDNESVLALVDGKPAYQPPSQDFSLHPDDPASAAESARTLEAIREAHRPGRTAVTSLEAHDRELTVLIASVQVAGDDAEGIFVVASDVGPPKRALWGSAGTFALLSVLTLLVSGWVAYLVIGRLLRPLGALREATGQITVDELERRIPVPEGRDDIAALARNFNRMLDRIQSGFAEQRRFMSDVGHELRTPLTIVRGTLEMTDVEDPADVREAHEIATDELDRMGRVVGDLSELAASSRPDYVRPRPVDLGEFARSALARVERIGPRHWELVRSVELVADVDDQRLMQAVVQLAANAVRYSDEGSRVRLGVDQVLGPDGPELHVSVQDEGIGIAPEDQHRIFERFARVDDSRGSGSGLGLPIVLAIAEGHGGVVRVLSRPGAGSTFTLVLPLRTEGAGAASEAPSRTDRDTGQDRSTQQEADGTAPPGRSSP